MAISISNTFSIKLAEAIDDRLTVADITARDNIVFTYPGLKVYVQSEGKFYFWNSVQWVEFVNSTAQDSLLLQKNLQVVGAVSGDNVTTGLVCNLNVTGDIIVIVNGISYVLENSLSDVAYFSSDSGTTATSSFSGATLYWNSTNAGFDLATTDRITFKGFGTP